MLDKLTQMLDKLTQISDYNSHPVKCANAIRIGASFFSMQFIYEIPVEEYAAGQVLYYKASIKGRGVKNAVIAALFGLLGVMVAGFRRTSDWAPILLFLAGSGFIYGGIATLFPTRHYGKHYRKFYFHVHWKGQHVHIRQEIPN